MSHTNRFHDCSIDRFSTLYLQLKNRATRVLVKTNLGLLRFENYIAARLYKIISTFLLESPPAIVYLNIMSSCISVCTIHCKFYSANSDFQTVLCKTTVHGAQCTMLQAVVHLVCCTNSQYFVALC